VMCAGMVTVFGDHWTEFGVPTGRMGSPSYEERLLSWL